MQTSNEHFRIAWRTVRAGAGRRLRRPESFQDRLDGSQNAGELTHGFLHGAGYECAGTIGRIQDGSRHGVEPAGLAACALNDLGSCSSTLSVCLRNAWATAATSEEVCSILGATRVKNRVHLDERQDRGAQFFKLLACGPGRFAQAEKNSQKNDGLHQQGKSNYRSNGELEGMRI